MSFPGVLARMEPLPSARSSRSKRLLYMLVPEFLDTAGTAGEPAAHAPAGREQTS
ncbi:MULTISPECIES: hypothetical protein [unclassified Micromonospora]|uniref:hypothetical protein n=1 Tax=Micromonospora TaxID=1873 RepID=UPI0015EFA0A0|nr:hypothetical protein [Micromonospora provocatoris]